MTAQRSMTLAAFSALLLPGLPVAHHGWESQSLCECAGNSEGLPAVKNTVTKQVLWKCTLQITSPLRLCKVAKAFLLGRNVVGSLTLPICFHGKELAVRTSQKHAKRFRPFLLWLLMSPTDASVPEVKRSKFLHVCL